jgi:hypothetical protein
MQWIQRNLFYVVWGGVALVLTALAFVFWYSGYRRNAELDEQLTTEKQQLEAQLRADPRPTAENAKLVRDDTVRIEKQVAEARKVFRPAGNSRLDAAAFRKLLDDSIFDLNTRAKDASVAVPPNYNYTFSAQRISVNFAPGSIGRLLTRLDDVKSLCQVLFDARVYSIESLRRSSASEDEALTSPDLLVTKPATNAVTGLVRYPYEIVFTGFTRELAKVMEGLNRSADFFVVRNVGVAAAPPPPAPVLSPGAIQAQPGAPRPFPPSGVPGVRRTVNPDDPDDVSGNSTADDPEMATAAPNPAAAAAPRGPQFRPATSDTVLDEQLLQFTLTVDLIRAPAGAKPQ